MISAIEAIEKKELKDSASYIQSLPKPVKNWSQIRPFFSPKIAYSIEESWKLLGMSLSAFFSDTPNPLPDLMLEKEVDQMIQAETSKYLSLSILLFQAEHYLRKEAIIEGTDLSNLRRSDFVKLWALEGCICEIILYRQHHWEGYSQAQWKERKRETIRYSKGEIEQTAWERMVVRWKEEDSKLALGSPSPESCMPFSQFCIEVFKKYRAQLPEFAHFTELWMKGDFLLKPLIINGEVKSSKPRKSKKTLISP